MMKRSLLLAAILPVWGTGMLLAAEERGVTVEDIFEYQTARQIEISKDGDWVAWTQRRPDSEKDKLVGDIWICSLQEDATPLQMTRGPHNDHSPAWSPDREWLYFLTDRSEKTQIWKISTRGGEAREVTSRETGVTSFEVSAGGDLIVLASEPPTLYEKKLKEKEDDSRVVEDVEHFPPQRLFRVDPEDGSFGRLTDNEDQISEYALSNDGRWIVTRHTTNPWEEVDYREKPIYFLWDLEEETHEQIWNDPRFDPSGLDWSPDSKSIFGVTVRTSYPERESYVGVAVLNRFDLDSRETVELDLEHEWGLGEIWRGPTYLPTRKGFVAGLAAGARNQWAVYEGRGRRPGKKLLSHDLAKNIHGLWLSEDEKSAVFLHSAAGSPPQIYTASWRSGRLSDPRALTQLNQHLEKKVLARTEIYRWASSKDGAEVEGLLFYPLDYEEGRPYPLMVTIHGGPTSVDLDMFGLSWTEYPHLLAAKGCFTLMPNYRGGTNYGLEFAEAIIDHYYDFEVPDILSGVDALVAAGMADPERLGIMGWSNGGILTVGILVETDRFRAASPGAADVNWTSDFGNCAFGPHFDRIYFDGEPWSNREDYVEKSPLFEAERIVTPTIIFFGEEDTSVPTSQGWELYRALQQIGKAPVRFVLFPGEPHGLRKISHQRRKVEEEIAWWEKYLFETLEPPNEALEEDSPLDLALKRKDWSATPSGALGEWVEGVLAPEISSRKSEGGIGFSRFEVTRAQYSAYLGATPKVPEGLVGWNGDGDGFEPGTENLPVSGVSFRDAAAYCAWLSESTGRHYRLPTQEELNAVIEKSSSAAAKENNLCYWAGYSPNPGDSRKLREELGRLAEKAQLLMEVGRFPPSMEDLYDLQGNVAEWVAGENGEGKLAGLFPAGPCDGEARYLQPSDAAFHGFRVVLEAEED